MTDKVESYTVGWVCAIPIEHAIACELLDEEYTGSQTPKILTRHDNNLYTFGRIHEHNVVIACLPQGRYGTTSAALVTERMQASFPALRFGLLVGIAGGAPSDKHDIRLGDVVVSSPTPRHGGVIQYDFGKALNEHKFEETGYLAPPPEVLLSGLASLTSKHIRRGHKLEETVAGIIHGNKRLQTRYGRPDQATDKLYEASGSDTDQLVEREDREDNLVVHHGLVASANRLMKDRKARNALIKEHDVLCFEMEAAGVMNSFPCLVIRGICDYADADKNDAWQGYAAAMAAAYAKELLEIIPGKDVRSMQTMEDMSRELHKKSFDVSFSLIGMPVPKNFVERPIEMQRLQQTLLPDNRRRRKLAVLRGLGGIGKTQLAVEFARQNKDNFSAIGWLDAGSEDKLKQSMASFADRISPNLSKSPDHPDKKGDIDAVIAKLLSWLSDRDNDRWLLVFDNVDRDLDDPTDPLAYNIEHYLPSADHGSILVTTRLIQLEQLGHSQEIRKVNESIAHEILVGWYSKANDTAHCKRLLELLDGLPLAIAQAGAYLQQSGMHVEEYIRKYEEKKEEVNRMIQRPDFKLQDYPNRNVWTTWTISYEAILKRNEHAAHLLLLWSFFDRNDLWHGIIVENFDQSIMDALKQQIGDIFEQESSFLEAIQLLRNYSLVEGNENTEGYTMHAVVHRWAYLFQTPQSRSDLGQLAFVTMGIVAELVDELASPRQERRLLPHVQACCEQIYSTKTGGSKVVEDWIRGSKLGSSYIILNTFDKIGFFYYRQGRYAEAEWMYERALECKEEVLEHKHMSTLDTLNDLGMVYQAQNRLTEAEQMLQRTLEGTEEVLGCKHISTLKTYNNLGLLYHAQNKLAEAEQMYKRALEGMEEVLGCKHISTLRIVANLGTTYYTQDRFGEAEQMYTRAIQGYTAAIDPEDLKIYLPALEIIWNLGNIYFEGRPDDAKEMYSKALYGYRFHKGESSRSCVRLKKKLEKVELLLQSRQETGAKAKANANG